MSRSRVEYLVGRKIRTASTNAGMTLCALGQKLGVSRPTIYAYATGALHVPESRIKEIARVTGQNVDFFSVQDEDEVVDLSEQLRLIDATLSPPDPRTASKLALAVIESRSEHDDPATMAQLAFRAGNALLQHGDYFDAIQQLEHARKTYLNLGQIRQAASCSQSIGYCYINLGKIDKAKESFEYSRNYSTSDQKWLGTVSLAALSERIGDFDQAQLELDRLIRLNGQDDEIQTYVYANLASIYCARTDWKEAQPIVEDALDQAFKTRIADQVVEMLVLDAIVRLRVGEIDRSSESLIRAGDICLGLADESRRTLIDVAWGEFFLEIEDFEKAREAAVSALTTATRGQYRRSEGQALKVLAEIALRRKDFDQARDYALQLSSHSESNQYPVTEAISKVILGSAMFRLGSIDKANALCENALTASRALRLPEVEIRAEALDAQINPSFDHGDSVVRVISQAVDEGLIPLAWRIYYDLGEQLDDENRLKCQTRIPRMPQTYQVAVIDAGKRCMRTLANSRK